MGHGGGGREHGAHGGARGREQAAGGRRQAADGTHFAARGRLQLADGRRLAARGKGQMAGSRHQARASRGMPRRLPPEEPAMYMWTDAREHANSQSLGHVQEDSQTLDHVHVDTQSLGHTWTKWEQPPGGYILLLRGVRCCPTEVEQSACGKMESARRHMVISAGSG